MDDCHKYIIIETMGHKAAIIFDLLLEHADVASDRYVVSAGFYEVYPIKKKVIVFGKSVSLKVNSNKEDEKLIEKILFSKDYNF